MMSIGSPLSSELSLLGNASGNYAELCRSGGTDPVEDDVRLAPWKKLY